MLSNQPFDLDFDIFHLLWQKTLENSISVSYGSPSSVSVFHVTEVDSVITLLRVHTRVICVPTRLACINTMVETKSNSCLIHKFFSKKHYTLSHWKWYVLQELKTVKNGRESSYLTHYRDKTCSRTNFRRLDKI